MPKFAGYMKRVGDVDLLNDVYVLAGVAPIKSPGAARYVATKVPGMDVPDEYVQRMADAAKGIPKKDRRLAEQRDGKRESTSVSRSSSRYARFLAYQVCTSWPSNGKAPYLPSSKGQACCLARPASLDVVIQEPVGTEYSPVGNAGA